MVFRALSAGVALIALAPFVFAVACGPKTAETAAPLAPAEPTEHEMPEHVFADGPCAERNAAERFVQTHRQCASDADCDVMMPACACAVGVQKSFAAEAKKRSASAYSACIARKLPMPCATCPPAPPPKCTDGTCRP